MKDAEAPGRYDADATRAKYLEERDKRLIEGRAASHELSGDSPFAHYRRDPFTEVAERAAISDDVDAVIIGAGMGGVVTGAELRRAGLGRIRLLDEAGDVGGTWYWNRYPGLMCDIESYTYLPMLEELGYVPKHRYASGDEIREHFERIADRWRLRDDALFHTRVLRTEWDEASRRWHVHTDRGDEIRARYVVMSVGILHLMKLPVIPDMERFQGRAFHTARWDYAYTGGDLHGGLHKLADKVVALVGSGGSAVQCVPHLAESAKQLLVFQRTPSAVGVRDNRPTEAGFARDLAPGWQRARMENFQAIIQGLPVEQDLVDDGWTWHFGPTHSFPRDPAWSPQEYGRRLVAFDFEVMEAHRRRIEETVHDPATAEALKPYYQYICKRPLWHDEFLPAFNAPNVELVDCPRGIERLTETGLMANGREYAADCIIYATGFEGESTPFPRRAGHDIVGRDGLVLAEKWADGPKTLFGAMSRGFPNLFLMPCPFQQGVVTPNFTHITVETAEHIAWTVARLDERGVAAFDVSAEAEERWCEEILATRIDPTPVMSLCTPSRLNNEGDPGGIPPLAANWGGGLGDFFAFKARMAQWRARGDLEGLELEG